MNKLAVIHYTNQYSQVRPFFTSETRIYNRDYSNVVDCSLGNYLLEKYETDENFQYMNVSLSLELMRDTNQGWLKETERLRLRLKKSIHTTTNEVNDVVVFRCSSCGGNLSLLNGGICQYCGKQLNLVDYDWVIDEYQVL